MAPKGTKEARYVNCQKEICPESLFTKKMNQPKKDNTEKEANEAPYTKRDNYRL